MTDLLKEATPRPWHVDGPTTDGEGYDCHYVGGDDGTTVAETDAWRSGDLSAGRDARLIVAAVNDYERLLQVERAARALVDAVAAVDVVVNAPVAKTDATVKFGVSLAALRRLVEGG